VYSSVGADCFGGSGERDESTAAEAVLAKAGFCYALSECVGSEGREEGIETLALTLAAALGAGESAPQACTTSVSTKDRALSSVLAFLGTGD